MPSRASDAFNLGLMLSHNSCIMLVLRLVLSHSSYTMHVLAAEPENAPLSPSALLALLPSATGGSDGLAAPAASLPPASAAMATCFFFSTGASAGAAAGLPWGSCACGAAGTAPGLAVAALAGDALGDVLVPGDPDLLMRAAAEATGGSCPAAAARSWGWPLELLGPAASM